MNLGELLDFCGNLLDYDPSNDTYRAQLVTGHLASHGVLLNAEA